MHPLIHRLIRADEGQDIIEYALLTAGLGLVGIAVWPAITNAVGVVYGNLDGQTQDLWEVPDPGGS